MSTKITVNFDQKTGKKVMPLHGFNSGPMTKVFTYDARPWFVKGGFPYVRLHDVEYPYGSGEFVDIPCIFKDFDKDENDPANYNFGNTDEYIRQSLNVGSKIIYRLGVSIEHSPVKRYTYAPKDFAKWARICEHIIMHYNEGWADGHRWNIEYWEIWNEADLGKPSTWIGTPEEFYEFYCVSASYLKSRFPELKIGGCGWASTKAEFTQNFIKYIAAKETRIPLDFHSWHRYAPDAHIYIDHANTARALLDKYGYSDAESILDEWNLVYSWDFEGQAASYPAMKDERGAAFYAATLAALQEHTDVAVATNFEADVVKEFCGILNVDKMCVGGLSVKDKLATLKPTKGFYAFMRYNTLYRLGDQVLLEGSGEDILATAAAGEQGVGLLLTNQTEQEQMVQLKLAGVCSPLVIRLTDKDHTDEKISEIKPEKDAVSMMIQLAPHSFAYIGTDLEDPIPTCK